MPSEFVKVWNNLEWNTCNNFFRLEKLIEPLQSRLIRNQKVLYTLVWKTALKKALSQISDESASAQSIHGDDNVHPEVHSGRQRTY